MKSPNLLFLYTDEQRFDTLAAYGNDRIEMPNLNQLARYSCVFDRAYVTQPVCTPARASLLTGLMPHSNGCLFNNIPLDEKIPCLPEMLPDDRYVTAHFGKWHLGDEVFPQHGFEHWLAIEQYNKHFRPGRNPNALSDHAQWLLDQGIQPQDGRFFSRSETARLPEEFSKPAFLGQNASDFIRTHQDQPFCLYVNFLEPHMPFFGPRDNQYDPADIPLPANFDSPPTEQNHLKSRYRHMEQKKGLKFETWVNDPKSMRQLIARYWGLCSQVDTHCGTILDTLKECGLWDDTIIVFTSDHGDMMGSHQLIEKGVMYEESVRVPLLVKLPGQREMRRIKGLVSQLDLVPTLLDMMEAEAPEHLEGTSRLETLSSAVGRIEDDVVIEWNMDKANPQEPRIVDEDSEFNYENVKAALQDPVRTIISGDGRWKLNVSPQLEQHELYDLQSDPYERENIFGRDDTRQITGELVERLRAWQRQTEDTVEIPDI